MDAKTTQKIEAAVVNLVGKGGQGVLVPGGFILTAAHCLEFNCEGGMVLAGDYFIEEVKTSLGKIKAAPAAIEPISDIAVLGALDNQTFGREADAFENFCRRVKPLMVSRRKLPREFRVYVYTHERTLIEGVARRVGDDAVLFITTRAQIHGGTSGGPIVDEAGEIVGIASNFSDGDSCGTAPRPHLALPAWVCRKILSRDDF